MSDHSPKNGQQQSSPGAASEPMFLLTRNAGLERVFWAYSMPTDMREDDGMTSGLVVGSRDASERLDVREVHPDANVWASPQSTDLIRTYGFLTCCWTSSSSADLE